MLPPTYDELVQALLIIMGGRGESDIIESTGCTDQEAIQAYDVYLRACYAEEHS